MKRFTSKIIFLLGILAQGVFSAGKAQPPLAFAEDARLRDLDSNIKLISSLELPKNSSQIKIEQLKPLTIDEVEKLAELNNGLLKAAEAQVDQAKSLLLSEISRWYPTVNLSANGLPKYLNVESYRNPDFTTNTKVNSQTGAIEPAPYTNGRQWTAQLSLQVKWNIIDPQRVPSIAAARDRYEKAKYNYEVTKRNLRLEALSYYILLQRADEGVRIGKQSMRASLVSLRYA